MELKINVDETKFKDIIEKELEAFSKEELHDIIRDMIVESFKTDNVLQSFFTVKYNTRSWGDPVYETRAGELLEEAAKTFDLSDCFKEIQDSMINEIKNNHKDLVEKVMLDMIVSGLTNSYDFCNRISYQIEQIIRNRNSQ